MKDLRVMMSWCTAAKTTLSPVPRTEAIFNVQKRMFEYRQQTLLVRNELVLEILKVLANCDRRPAEKEGYTERLKELISQRKGVQFSKVVRRLNWPPELMDQIFEFQPRTRFKIKVLVVGEDETEGA